MILGIGNDLCDIRRIQASLDRFGDRFTGRIFTPLELERAAASQIPANSLAKRFAAKEAAAKAVGVGLWREGVTFHDFEVRNDARGGPSLHLTGAAHDHIHARLPDSHYAHFHVSLTDDGPWAQAFVIIEARARQ